MLSFVECYSGLMGGGKSYSAVERMLRHIAGGGVVYSNILLKLEPWHNYDYSMPEFSLPELNDEVKCARHGLLRLPCFKDTPKGREWVYNSHGAKHYLRRFLNWEYQEGQFNYIPDDSVGSGLMHDLPCGTVDRPVLVVLDEALDHFESCGTNVNAEFRSFLRHVRKLGINLIFIAQDFASLEKKIRVLTHYVWTFRDLKTWKVPCIGAFLPGGVLPRPWSDHIQQRQFHQKQFGQAKAEHINKNMYAMRDPFIFQCYQSVSLHNAAITMNGTAQDFGDSGRIKKGRSKVSKVERIVIYVLLAAALWFSFRKASAAQPPAVIGSGVVSAPVVAPPVPRPEKFTDGYSRNSSGEIVERLPISWIQKGASSNFWIEGVSLSSGVVTVRGVVESVSSSVIKFRDIDGRTRWVYHAPAISPARTNSAGLAKI